VSDNLPDINRPTTVGKPNRSSAEIKRDIEAQREDFGQSVEALRTKFSEITDWRRHVREHKRELVTGAAVAGFVIGGIIALRRRR
jgi:Protein of unknown function (DUF3618)